MGHGFRGFRQPLPRTCRRRDRTWSRKWHGRKTGCANSRFSKTRGRSPASRVLNTTNLAGPFPKINDPAASDGSSL